MQHNGLDSLSSQKDVELIQDTIQRMVKIIKGLLAFARKSDQDPMQWVELRYLFEETLALCATRARHQGVKVSIELD
ncbi:MAG: hypothetical protein EBY22_06660, partial [Gammaproteobacteria bacterium]|nr:hypothetical protein [Gammaproteobacteria bacterium]